MTAKKEIAKKDEVALTERPNWIKEGEARGSEEVSSSDITLPRLQIIQDLSPQHKKTKEEFIEGAEVGDFFNTATQGLYKESAMIVPVYFRVEYIIWKEQKAGGGFFGAFDTEVEAARELRKVKAENGGNDEDYEIVLTNVHFVLLIDGDDPTNVEQVVISMSKSQNKVSRSLNTMIKLAGGDRFSRVYKLSTFVDKNKAGQEYMNWKVKPMGWVTEDIYKLGEESYDAIKTGQRAVDYGSGEKSAGQSEAKKPDVDGDFDDEFTV